MFTIILEEDFTQNLIDRLEELESQEAMVGFKAEQGIHEDSGLPYVSLMNILHHGNSEERLPPRPLNQISVMTFKGSRVYKKRLTEYLSNISNKRAPKTAEYVVQGWAEDFHEHSKKLFGDSTVLTSNRQFTIDRKKKTKKNSPLLDTGDLKENWSVWINNKKVS